MRFCRSRPLASSSPTTPSMTWSARSISAAQNPTSCLSPPTVGMPRAPLATALTTAWVNRAGDPVDRLYATPHPHFDLTLPQFRSCHDAFLSTPPTEPSFITRKAGPAFPCWRLSGLTRNTRDFDHVAPHLPVRLIRMDYRGRGESEWADYKTYNIPQEAADALALLDHLGLEQAAILGHLARRSDCDACWRRLQRIGCWVLC